MPLPHALTAAACLWLVAEGARADEGGPQVKLTGVVHWNGRSLALLEITPKPGRFAIKPILGAGERVDSVEILDVDSRTGRVLAQVGGSKTLLVVDDAPMEEGGRTLHFKAADSAQVIEVFEILSGRTVLRPSNLPVAKITLRTATLVAEDALRTLEQALLAKAIVLQLRESKFAFAIGATQVNRLSFIPDPTPADSSLANANELFPAGLIRFADADASQVLEIYQEISGRTLLRPDNLRGRCTLRTRTELTRAQVLWVLDAALALENIAMVPHGERFVFALPGIENPQVPPVARHVPPPAARAREPLPAGMLKFSATPVQQVAGVYANLLGREPLAESSAPPNARLSIRSQTALTIDEALFALDALAALNQFRFELVGDKHVQISLFNPASSTPGRRVSLPQPKE